MKSGLTLAVLLAAARYRASGFVLWPDPVAPTAGPAGPLTELVTHGAFGGMAANDGPMPVRALSQAARLIRDARHLGQYGIVVSEPVLDYRRLLARVREVVDDVDAHVAARDRIDPLGVAIHDHAGSRSERKIDNQSTNKGKVTDRIIESLLETGKASRAAPGSARDLDKSGEPSVMFRSAAHEDPARRTDLAT